MNNLELVLVLLVIVTALTPIARKLRVPYPVLLVLGGLVLALIPAFPDIPLDPDLAFLLFLPPLLYSAAFNTSIRDFRRLLRPILSLAVGLVLATTALVAVLLHLMLPELGWPAAFAFGAIVSPPDAVAAVAVFRGLGVPPRLVTLLEGESLVNDATAIVTYRAAVGAMAAVGAVGTSFSAGATALSFPVVAIGGLAVGLVVGVFVGWLRRLLDDPPVEIALSLLTPFAAYLPAEQLGFSGVMATVAAGLFLGWREPYFSHSEVRISGRAVWNMIDFVLNGLVFILIGLQLSTILRALAGRSLLALIGTGLLLSLAAIALRMVWVFLDASLRRLLAWWRVHRVPQVQQGPPPARSPIERSNPPVAEPLDSQPSWKEAFVVSWAGMRGVVSLATALALPQATPERNLLVFLAFVVILVTLVGQGLSLPLLIRTLGVGVDRGAAVQQELHARRTASEAALSRIDRLRDEWPAHLPLIDALRSTYEHRASHLGSNSTPQGADGSGDAAHEDGADQELIEHHVIRRAVIDAERAAVLHLRERGEINDQVWREIERDLDLEEMRMDA